MILQKLVILLLFSRFLIMLGWQDMIKVTIRLKIKLFRGGKPAKQWSSFSYVKKKLVESQSQELTK